MPEEEMSETTALTSGTPKPRYAFESSIARERRTRLRQFQSCVCVIFLATIIVALVVSVAYSINGGGSEKNETIANSSFIILMQKWPLEDKVAPHGNINRSEYAEALEAGKKALRRREEIERTTPELDKDSPSYKHQKVVATSDKGRSLSKLGYAEEYATRHINRANKTLCFNETSDIFFSEACSNTTPQCNIYTKFRTYDGSCNNLKHPISFGVAYKPFRRILPPEYADGISAPRTSKDGKGLPAARTVSVVVHRPIYHDDPKFTVMLAVFGQFIDHDITATALNQGEDGSSISCCADNIKELHPECFPVKLDSDDPFYKDYNVTCMEFVRSASAPTCCFGPRQQLNQASSFIDGSVIYGTDNDVTVRLRSFTGGKLKMFVTDDYRELLPVSDDPDDGCNREEEGRKGRYCFMTGDARANENLHLTSMHLLWARQHNAVARKLGEVNPFWDDERLFLESRRVVGAQLQHIMYNEFLGVILPGFNLQPLKKGYYKGYNESVDASIANSFAASAFRFAHTLIPSLMKMVGNDTSSEGFVELHRMLFDPFVLYRSGVMDSAIRGAMRTPIQASDPYFSPELKEHMFARPVAVDSVNSTKLCGLDLVSLNIQRGRDHGLAGYTSWREHCGLPRPRTFNQLSADIDDDSLRYIQSIYRDVDDIDLYTGALSERPLANAFLGPTITCLLADQFVRLKNGDRFWFENPARPQAFTPRQLQEIRKTTLARVICDNSDGVAYVQRDVMRRIDGGNKVVSCGVIDKLDLDVWREDLRRVAVPDDAVELKRIEN